MAAPTITSLSTTIGPANQWIYIFGTDFVDGQTQIYFTPNGSVSFTPAEPVV